MRKLKKLYEYFWYVLIIAFIIISVRKCSSSTSDRKNRALNPKYTIGQIIELIPGSRTKLKYQYFVKGKSYTGRTLTRHYKNGSKYGFYKIKYEKDNPSNSELVKNSKKYTFSELLKKGKTINGIIKKITSINNKFYDIYINYYIEKNSFSFRVRLDQDSLPCKKVVDCKYSSIPLKVYEKYPFLNDLYFKSLDRQKKGLKDSKILVEKE